MAQAKDGVKFLGVILRSVGTSIQPKKIVAFKEKVKRVAWRNSPVNLEKSLSH